MEYGWREYIVSVHILRGVHKALYKIPQKIDEELPYSPEYSLDYGESGIILFTVRTRVWLPTSYDQ